MRARITLIHKNSRSWQWVPTTVIKTTLLTFLHPRKGPGGRRKKKSKAFVPVSTPPVKSPAEWHCLAPAQLNRQAPTTDPHCGPFPLSHQLSVFLVSLGCCAITCLFLSFSIHFNIFLLCQILRMGSYFPCWTLMHILLHFSLPSTKHCDNGNESQTYLAQS